MSQSQISMDKWSLAQTLVVADHMGWVMLRVLGAPLQSTICVVMRKSYDLLQSGQSETAGMMSNLCPTTKTAASMIYTFVLICVIKICLVYSCSKYSSVSFLLDRLWALCWVSTPVNNQHDPSEFTVSWKRDNKKKTNKA